MQNKATLLDIQMNVSYVKTKNYEQRAMGNEPIEQSQTKPISIPKTLLIVYNASKFFRNCLLQVRDDLVLSGNPF